VPISKNMVFPGIIPSKSSSYLRNWTPVSNEDGSVSVPERSFWIGLPIFASAMLGVIGWLALGVYEVRGRQDAFEAILSGRSEAISQRITSNESRIDRQDRAADQFRREIRDELREIRKLIEAANGR